MNKQKDKTDLNEVLDKAPAIVARSILLLLRNSRESAGGESPHEFWRNIELG